MLADLLLSPSMLALSLVLPFALWLWLGLAGDWPYWSSELTDDDGCDESRRYAPERLMLLRATLITFPVLLILYLVVR